MRRRVAAAFVLLLLAACGGDGDGGARSLGFGSWEGTGILVIEGATVFTSPSAVPIQDGIVVVADGRIEAVGARGELSIPQSARRVSGSGASLFAGFWDTHVRLDVEMLLAAADPEVPDSELEEWFGENLLRYGFTGIVESGTPIDLLQPLLDRMASGSFRGPAIVPTGGVPLRDFRVGGGDDAAWAAATSGSLLVEDVGFAPALSLLLPAGDAEDAEVELAMARIAVAQAEIQAFRAVGGRVVFGSGFGWDNMLDPLFEMELLSEGGLPFDALIAALTTEPLLKLGFGDRGEVEPGMAADLILVDGDPRADLSALERVRWVMRGGVPMYGTIR